MSIFSKHGTRDHKTHSGSKTQPRPKLYIIASTPSRFGQPNSCEWSFELTIPTKPAIKDKQGFAILHHKKKAPAETDTQVQHAAEHEKHYYFNRLNHGKYTTDKPATSLRIFLTSFPVSPKAYDGHGELLHSFGECFEHIYMTPDSASWLRQALFSLQISEVIPPASHGLDINNFMSFATSCLEGHLHKAAEQENVKEVNYPKVVRHNQHLKRMLGADGTSYAVLDGDKVLDESDEDDDFWDTSVRGQGKEQKGWGGFWISYGSAGDRSRDSSRERGHQQHARVYRPRGDVYGGLM